MDNQSGFIVPTANKPSDPIQAPPSSPQQPSQQPKVKHAHKFIFGYIVLILLVAACAGVYSWQHSKVNKLNKQVSALTAQVSNSAKKTTTTSSTNSQSSTATPSTNSNVVISYPLSLTNKEVLTTLHLPTAYNALQVKASLSTPVELAEDYTESLNDVMANWEFTNTGTTQAPAQFGETLSNLTITALNAWMATADTGKESYTPTGTATTATGPMTVAQKSAFVAALKSQTATCAKNSADGFATTDGIYNICYSLVHPQAAGGDYAMSLSGYADLSGTITYLRGTIYLPNSYQTPLNTTIQDLKLLSTTVQATPS